ncbi:hypothetical protein BDY19DRAFT_894498 [Irpex rosettiformis]|uniref:Uncharacterized protein n=1 Tax=Irpex rosettiformis TaxID=378272 RepID=A0ACB8TX50_9APHY|nr:hypothetical protein BDY19DRAFT_894498 [Irpex rosettiformis]
MSQSVFASFDPLAVHPFTNSSGLLPKPAQPSQYPHPLPSPATLANPTVATQGYVHAPIPKHKVSQSTRIAQPPIFVPFRPDRSSPDLDDILLKKKVRDLMTNKETWSIDRAGVPVVARR